MRHRLRVSAGAFVAVVVVSALAGTRPAFAASSAVRSFGTSYYIPFEPVTVTVQVTPDPAVQVWAAEDAPPAGWTVTNISHNGVWDAATGKVKWGVFYNRSATTLTYRARPPVGEDGVKTFAGTAVLANAATDEPLALTGASTLSRNTSTVYTLTTRVVGGHGTLAPSSGSYPAGSVVTLTASPDAGYRVRVWSGTDHDDSTENTNSVAMTGNRTVSVEFEAIPLPQYALQTAVSPAGAGSVARQPDAAQYAQGTSVTLTATPAGTYVFDHWEGDLDGTENPRAITMDAARSVTAVFVAGYTLGVTVLPTGAGTVMRNPDRPAYRAGATVTLTAAPKAGYVFDHWAGSLSGAANPAALTISQDMSVTAFFVTTDCNQNGITDATDIAHGTSRDCDVNGIPDECEADTDEDGVIDACDNCPAVANADQRDGDGNGVGDACQVCPTGNDCFMPADTNHSWTLEIDEVTAYGAAWRTGTTWPAGPATIPIEFVTRAGYLWRKGGQYHLVEGQPPPACWQEGAAGP